MRYLKVRHESAKEVLKSVDEKGWSGFMIACKKGQEPVVKILLSHSESKNFINLKNEHGQTGFMLACWMGHILIVKQILQSLLAKEILDTTDNQEWRRPKCPQMVKLATKFWPKKADGNRTTGHC